MLFKKHWGGRRLFKILAIIVALVLISFLSYDIATNNEEFEKHVYGSYLKGVSDIELINRRSFLIAFVEVTSRLNIKEEINMIEKELCRRKTK